MNYTVERSLLLVAKPSGDTEVFAGGLGVDVVGKMTCFYTGQVDSLNQIIN